MLGLSELKQTRVYQEAREEGLKKALSRGLNGVSYRLLGMIRRLQQRGFSLEEIAELLELDLATIRISSRSCLKHYTCFKLPNLSREDSEAMLWLSELKRQDFIKKRKGGEASYEAKLE